MFPCCVNNNPVIEPGRRPGPSGLKRNPLQSSENREQVFQKLAQNSKAKIFYDNRGDLVAATTGVETINVRTFTGPVKVYKSSSISAETYRETVKYKERGRVKYQALLFDGELENGEYKKGTLYEDNKSFTGCFKYEKPDGEVTVVTTGKDGQTTTSVETWKNGVVWTGNGSLRKPEIKIPNAFEGFKASMWEGNIKDGKPSGRGTLTLSKTVALSSSFSGLRTDYATQEILIKGNIHNGVFGEQATITFSDNLTFDATFTNGQLSSGLGTFVSARSEDARKGVRYDSDKSITFNTQGLISSDSVIQTTEHEIYEGPIENGERNGHGKLTITNNNRGQCNVVGEWEAGVIQNATLTVGSSTFGLEKSKGNGSYTISENINGEALEATVYLGPQRSALYDWLEEIKKDGLKVKLYRPENNSRTLVYKGTFSVEHGKRLNGKDVEFATPKREGTSQSGKPRKAEYKNGEIVKGEFKTPDGECIYTGHIKDGAPHGPGILHNWTEDGKDIETYFVRGRMTRRCYVLNDNEERIAVTSYNKMDDRNLCLQNKDKDRSGFLDDLAGSRKDLNEYEFLNEEDYLDNYRCAVQPPLLDTDPNKHPINRY